MYDLDGELNINHNTNLIKSLKTVCRLDYVYCTTEILLLYLLNNAQYHIEYT